MDLEEINRRYLPAQKFHVFNSFYFTEIGDPIDWDEPGIVKFNGKIKSIETFKDKLYDCYFECYFSDDFLNQNTLNRIHKRNFVVGALLNIRFTDLIQNTNIERQEKPKFAASEPEPLKLLNEHFGKIKYLISIPKGK